MVYSRQRASKTAHGVENSEKLFSISKSCFSYATFWVSCNTSLVPIFKTKGFLELSLGSDSRPALLLAHCSSCTLLCHRTQLPKLPQVSGGILTPEHFGGALFHGSGWSSKNGHRCLSLKMLCTSEAAFPRGLVLVKEGHLHPLVPSILWASCNLELREPCFSEAQSWRRHGIY